MFHGKGHATQELAPPETKVRKRCNITRVEMFVTNSTYDHSTIVRVSLPGG